MSQQEIEEKIKKLEAAIEESDNKENKATFSDALEAYKIKLENSKKETNKSKLKAETQTTLIKPTKQKDSSGDKDSVQKELEECETDSEKLAKTVLALEKKVAKLEEKKTGNTPKKTKTTQKNTTGKTNTTGKKKETASTQTNKTGKPQTKTRTKKARKSGNTSTKSGGESSSSEKTTNSRKPPKRNEGTKAEGLRKTKVIPPKKAEKEEKSVKKAIAAEREAKAEKETKKTRGKKTKGAKRIPVAGGVEGAQYLRLRKFVLKFKRMLGKSASFNWFLNFFKDIRTTNENGLLTKKTPQFAIIEDIFTYLKKSLQDPKFKEGDKKKIALTLSKAGQTIYEDIAASKLPLSIYYVKRYQNLLKSKDKRKANLLLKSMENAKKEGVVKEGDRYFDEFEMAIAFLKAGKFEITSQLSGIEEYVRGLEGVLRGLTGLGGLEGCGCKYKSPSQKLSGLGNTSPKESEGIEDIPDTAPAFVPVPAPEEMSTEEVLTQKLSAYDFQGKWKKIIDKPGKGFVAMIYGMRGSGKSTMSLQLANYMGDQFGKVLYVANEEYRTVNLQRNIRRNIPKGEGGRNITWRKTFRDTNDESPEEYLDLSKYKFLFIDSVSSIDMKIEELEEIKELYPELSIILIFHVTKSGDFRGDSSWGHLVDLEIEVKKGTATARKRYAGTETLEGIFSN